MIKKPVSLNQNRDFRRLYGRGKSAVHPLLVVYALPSRRAFNRFGITTSKKIGGAVQRNRARRIIREAERELRPLLRSGYDIVLVARKKTVLAKTQQITSALRTLYKKLGLLEAPPSNPTL